MIGGTFRDCVTRMGAVLMGRTIPAVAEQARMSREVVEAFGIVETAGVETSGDAILVTLRRLYNRALGEDVPEPILNMLSGLGGGEGETSCQRQIRSA